MTKVSIVSPVFDEERFLPSMLASVLDQTHDDWELLLVDDGSTDATADIIEEWAGRDPRIRAVSLRTKLGKVPAFNLAHAAARGDLVCHVGGDDVLPPDSLAVRVADLADAPPRAAHLGKLQMIDVDSRIISPPFPRGAKGSQSSPGATYTRELADLLFPIPADLPSEDIWLGNGAVACAAEVVHSPQTLIHYRVHDNNSNPRHKPFAEMSRSIHARARALALLLDSDLPLGEQARADLTRRVATEELRYRGDVLGILRTRDMRWVDKAATVSMSRPLPWRIRQRLGVLATGWRGR